MAQKKANVHRKKTKAKADARKRKSGAHIPASVRRAIEVHARKWQAAQKQEAKSAQKLAADNEKDRIQREESLAEAYGIAAELRHLVPWRAECRERNTGSQPQKEKSKS